MKKKLVDIVGSCGQVVTSTDDPEVKEGLGRFGYDDERLAEGKMLVKLVDNLIQKQSIEKSEMYSANEEFFTNRDNFNQLYTDDIRLCRVAFTNTSDLIKVVPNFTHIYPYAKWYSTAKKFYGDINGLSIAKEKLQRFNYTQDTIDSRVNDLGEINRLFQARAKEKGESEMATKERDEAIEKLVDYCNEIRDIARIAFGRKSQILEKMGIIVKG